MENELEMKKDVREENFETNISSALTIMQMKAGLEQSLFLKWQFKKAMRKESQQVR